MTRAAPIDSITPALLLGNGITVLGTIRSLGRARIPVVCAESRGGVEQTSRFYKKAPLTIEATAGDDALVAYLRALPYTRCVVFPCTDHWSNRYSRVWAQMSAEEKQRFPWYGSAPEVIATFTDKDAFRVALEKHGVPAPQCIVVPKESPGAAIERVGSNSTFFIKPTDSQGFFRDFGRKAFRFNSTEVGRSLLESVYARGHAAILQELIPGGADNHYYIEGFIDGSGEVRALFARQRLRMYPDEFGNSTAMVSVPRAEVAAAEASLLRLLKREGFRGIFSAEFKKDSRDGVFKIIEVNVRPWWYVQFPTECGVNIPEIAYRSACGETGGVVASYRVGVSAVNAYTDLQVWKQSIREGRAGWWGLMRSWLGSYFTVFDWKDPRPGIDWLVERVRDQFSKGANGR